MYFCHSDLPGCSAGRADGPHGGGEAAVTAGVQEGQRGGEPRQREGRGHQGTGGRDLWVSHLHLHLLTLGSVPSYISSSVLVFTPLFLGRKKHLFYIRDRVTKDNPPHLW